MSIITAGGEMGFEINEVICFYCYNPLKAIGVRWRGAAGNMDLHPECVIELAIRLLRDVHEIECGTNINVTRSAP